MAIGQIWLIANPELNDVLRRAHEERAADFYRVWRRATGAVGKVVEAWQRARRKRQTDAALRGLSNHQLQDIGLHRSEISSVAQAIADEPLGASVTLADLRQVRGLAPRESSADAVALPENSQRRSPARPGARRAEAEERLAERIAS